MTSIINDWITLNETRKGITVQRKFAGLDCSIDQLNTVECCKIYYWERELYPNGDTIKIEKKHYILQNLAQEEVDVNGEIKIRPELRVLTGFINNLGIPYIINPARSTIENLAVMPIDVENGYILHSLTRPLQ